MGGADVTGERSGLVVIASVVRLCTGDTGISPGSHWKLRSSTFRRVHLGGRYGIVSLLLMLCPWPSVKVVGWGLERLPVQISPVWVIVTYIYHALTNALSAHMIHINLNMIFYTHVEHSPTKTIYIKYYIKNN